MTTGSNKILFLLLGIIFGFFVGGGIIWWQIHKKTPTSNNKNQVEKLTPPETKEIKAKKLKFKQQYASELRKYKIPDTFIDTLQMDSTTLTIEELIALYSKEENVATQNSGDNIVVSKDEKLHTKRITITGTYLGSSTAELDSILIDHHGSPSKAQNTIYVEFWKSPINYKGYKMDDITLVVFGLMEYDNLSLKAHRNKLYIKYSNEYYFVEPTDEFKPLLSVHDKSIIQELQSL